MAGVEVPWGAAAALVLLGAVELWLGAAFRSVLPTAACGVLCYALAGWWSTLENGKRLIIGDLAGNLWIYGIAVVTLACWPGAGATGRPAPSRTDLTPRLRTCPFFMPARLDMPILRAPPGGTCPVLAATDGHIGTMSIRCARRRTCPVFSRPPPRDMPIVSQRRRGTCPLPAAVPALSGARNMSDGGTGTPGMRLCT